MNLNLFRECINSGMDYWNGGMAFFKLCYESFFSHIKYKIHIIILLQFIQILQDYLPLALVVSHDLF